MTKIRMLVCDSYLSRCICQKLLGLFNLCTIIVIIYQIFLYIKQEKKIWSSKRLIIFYICLFHQLVMGINYDFSLPDWELYTIFLMEFFKFFLYDYLFYYYLDKAQYSFKMKNYFIKILKLIALIVLFYLIGALIYDFVKYSLQEDLYDNPFFMIFRAAGLVICICFFPLGIIITNNLRRTPNPKNIYELYQYSLRFADMRNLWLIIIANVFVSIYSLGIDLFLLKSNSKYFFSENAEIGDGLLYLISRMVTTLLIIWVSIFTFWIKRKGESRRRKDESEDMDSYVEYGPGEMLQKEPLGFRVVPKKNPKVTKGNEFIWKN